MGSETRADRIKYALESLLGDITVQVTDDSLAHAGHVGSSPSGETHFKLVVASKRFKDLSLVEQHRLVYSALEKELKSGLHAIEIQTKVE
ncbi:MAG: BolA family transcriptional regulator [Leptospira sp.]|jgi:BolA protein|nr:BolA family transcriptional regulator [Leptospira sp.]